MKFEYYYEINTVQHVVDDDDDYVVIDYIDYYNYKPK